METGFRVLGSEFGVVDSYVDCDIVGADPGGTIYIADSNDATRQWPLPDAKLEQLYDEKKICGSDDVPYPEHQIWDCLDEIENVRVDSELKAETHLELEEAAESIFRSILVEGGA